MSKRKIKANYTKPVRFTATDRYGCGPVDEDDVYTVKEFKARVKQGSFIDYDGTGLPVKGNLADSSIWIKPSKLNEIPKDATHIVWYNR